VRYEMLDSLEAKLDVENMDLEEKLSFGCRVSLESLQVLDRTSQLQRAKPFLAVTATAEAEAATVVAASAWCKSEGQLPKIQFAHAIAQEYGAFVLRFFKTHTFHSFIELEFREVEAVADCGLLMKLLGWIGRGGQISSASIQERVGEFKYNLARPGALWVQTTLPSASIHLVTCFHQPDPDRVMLGGLVAVNFAALRGQNTLSVDIKDFTLTSQSSQRLTSNAKMQIVTPCVFSYSQVWYTPIGGVMHPRQPQLFASAKDFNAMITYEDLLLARRIFSNITQSLHKVDDSNRTFHSPKQTSDEQMDEHGFLDSLEPEASTIDTLGPEECPSTPTVPTLIRQGTVVYRDRDGDLSPVLPADEGKPKPTKMFRIFGNSIRLTLVDDYNGRWIPLARLGIPNVMVSGSAGNLTSKLRVGIDFFHQPTSMWKSAVEPWEAEFRYEVEGKETTLSIDAQEEMCTAHVSVAGIESLRFAVSSWTQDRRSYAILKADDAAQTVDERRDTTYDDTLSVASARSHPNTFVPYTVRNLLAETLICILEDGEEHCIEPQHWLELTYQQVWRRRGALSNFAQRDADELGISNTVCLQLEGSKHVFCKVSVEVEQATSYEIQPADITGNGPPFPLHIVCDLTRSDGQKILSVSSMVTIMNTCNVPLMSGILAPDNSMRQVFPSGERLSRVRINSFCCCCMCVLHICTDGRIFMW